MKNYTIPVPLKKGDTLGIIAPAGQLGNVAEFEKGVSILFDMGFQVKFPRDLWPGEGYLADTDDNRVDELHAFFKDTEIKAIFALRGGYGSLRILNKLDLELIAANPKFLVGFSDVSILLNFLFERTGLVALHGPVVTSLADSTPETHERLFRSLTGQLLAPVEITDLEIICDGPVVRAPIAGGNLASLVTLLGTWADFNWDGKIVVLEEINEPLYKVDRMLTQLTMAGKLDHVAGVILGDFSFVGHQDSIEALRYCESIWNRVKALCGSGNVPVWANFPAGHSKRNLAFPVGIVGEMNKNLRQLSFHPQ